MIRARALTFTSPHPIPEAMARLRRAVTSSAFRAPAMTWEGDRTGFVDWLVGTVSERRVRLNARTGYFDAAISTAWVWFDFRGAFTRRDGVTVLEGRFGVERSKWYLASAFLAVLGAGLGWAIGTEAILPVLSGIVLVLMTFGWNCLVSDYNAERLSIMVMRALDDPAFQELEAPK